MLKLECWPGHCAEKWRVRCYLHFIFILYTPDPDSSSYDAVRGGETRTMELWDVILWDFFEVSLFFMVFPHRSEWIRIDILLLLFIESECFPWFVLWAAEAAAAALVRAGGGGGGGLQAEIHEAVVALVLVPLLVLPLVISRQRQRRDRVVRRVLRTLHSEGVGGISR